MEEISTLSIVINRVRKQKAVVEKSYAEKITDSKERFTKDYMLCRVYDAKDTFLKCIEKDRIISEDPEFSIAAGKASKALDDLYELLTDRFD